MADVNKSLEEQLAELQAKTDLLQAERDNLRKIVGDDAVGKVIAGSVKVELKTTDGKTEKKEVTIKDGHVRTHVLIPENDWNAVVDSEALVAHANGSMSEEQKAANPFLGTITSAEAKSYFVHLVQIKYAGIVAK